MINIVAKNEMWLTQATEIDEASRIFVRAVYTPNADMWRDATDAEKLTWEKEHPMVELPPSELN